MIDSIQNTQAVSAILAADSTHDKLEGNSKRKIAEELMKESDNYASDAKTKQEQAMQYIKAAETLEKLAIAVRQKAEALKNGEVQEEPAVQALITKIEEEYQMPVPKDASPELLEQIARSLEDRAKENRLIADNLLKQSEESDRLAKQLREQADFISKNELGFDELRIRTAQAHNEGLLLVIRKLYELDEEYKKQVAYAQKQEAIKV